MGNHSATFWQYFGGSCGHAEIAMQRVGKLQETFSHMFVSFARIGGRRKVLEERSVLQVCSNFVVLLLLLILLVRNFLYIAAV